MQSGYRWTDLHSQLHGAGYCPDPEFHSHDHSSCAEALCDLFCMCDKVHGAESAASAKAQLDWSCAYKAKTGFFQNETVWTNAAKIQMRQAWYKMYVKPWHPELAMVGMRVLSQVISASSCERNWSAHGHIHSKIRNRLDGAPPRLGAPRPTLAVRTHVSPGPGTHSPGSPPLARR